MRRREYLSVMTGAVAGSLAGCSEGPDAGGALAADLTIANRRLSYDDDGAATMYLDVENDGDATNIIGSVDLVWTSGDDEGDVFESTFQRAHAPAGETTSVEVPTTYYRFDQQSYEHRTTVEATSNPVARFEANPTRSVDGYWSPSVGETVELDATNSVSVDTTIDSYRWSLHEYGNRQRQDGKELPGLAPGADVEADIPSGEVIEFEVPDDEEIRIRQDDVAAMVRLEVTDSQGQTDDDWNSL